MEINRNEANALINAYQNDKSKLVTTSLFISREELNRILNDECTGIRIYLGQQNFKDNTGDYIGMTLVAARVTNADQAGWNYLENNLTPPCPKNCI